MPHAASRFRSPARVDVGDRELRVVLPEPRDRVPGTNLWKTRVFAKCLRSKVAGPIDQIHCKLARGSREHHRDTDRASAHEHELGKGKHTPELEDSLGVRPEQLSVMTADEAVRARLELHQLAPVPSSQLASELSKVGLDSLGGKSERRHVSANCGREGIPLCVEIDFASNIPFLASYADPAVRGIGRVGVRRGQQHGEFENAPCGIGNGECRIDGRSVVTVAVLRPWLDVDGR